MSNYTVKVQMEWSGATVTVTVRGDDLARVIHEAALARRKLQRRGATPPRDRYILALGRVLARDR